MTTPQDPYTSPCWLWPLVPECLPECWSPDPTKWTQLQRWSVYAAAAILKRLTAGIFNLCPIKIRPCRKRCGDNRYRYLDDPTGLPYRPVMDDGLIYNIACGCRSNDSCGCGPISEIILDPFAQAIIEVKVDGFILPPTAYRVDDWRKLVRIDGHDWPDCQELAKDDTQPGTFSVTYWTGTPPDPGASFALTDLAVEFWKSCQGKQCALGDNVRQVARQGITYDLDPVLESLREGRTGLKRVDMWIYSVNPHGLRRRFRVYSPDTVHGRRTTWPNPTIPGWPGGGPGPQEPTPCTQCAGEWSFPTPQLIWTVQHDFGFEPGGVQITDPTGREIRGEVTYPTPSTVQIAFNQPTAGRVRLS